MPRLTRGKFWMDNKGPVLQVIKGTPTSAWGHPGQAQGRMGQTCIWTLCWTLPISKTTRKFQKLKKNHKPKTKTKANKQKQRIGKNWITVKNNPRPSEQKHGARGSEGSHLSLGMEGGASVGKRSFVSLLLTMGLRLSTSFAGLTARIDCSSSHRE